MPRRTRPPTARERARAEADLTPTERRALAFQRQQAALRANGGRPRLEAKNGRLVVYNGGERLLRDVPGAAWDTEHSRWEVALTLASLRAVRRALGYDRPLFTTCCSPGVLAFARTAGAAEARIRDLHERMATGWRTPLPWLDRSGQNRAPFAHQAVMATVMCELDGMAALCEMGTGKTRSAVEAAAEHLERGTFDVLVVVCPQRVMPTWLRELRAWTDRFPQAVMLEGTIVARRATIERVAALPPVMRRGTALILNWDVLHHLEPTLQALAATCRVGLVADEMHKAANANARRTKALLRLAPRCAWRVGMTGTPIKTGAHDLWAQWYFVDLGQEFGASYVQFRREHLDENPYAHELTMKPGAAEGIRLRLARRGVRYRKEDCLDLPPKVPVTYEGTMTDEQAEAYRQMERDLLARLGTVGDADRLPDDQVATAATQLTMILRLSQITSGFLKTEAGTIHRFTPNPKLDLVSEVVREQVDSGRSVILWAWYREDQEQLLRHFADLRPLTITGGQTLAQHAAVEDAFQAERSRLIIANQAAGGAGITLTAASFAIYYSQGYSLIDRIQSEDRCHRPGSERHTSITIADAVLRGTVDEIVREAIAKKQSTADTLLALRRHLETDA